MTKSPEKKKDDPWQISIKNVTDYWYSPFTITDIVGDICVPLMIQLFEINFSEFCNHNVENSWKVLSFVPLQHSTISHNLTFF